jgi:uncharacterized membrane protein YfcA
VDPTLFLLVTACVLLASFCQSTTGFGFALVLVPLLSLFWDIKATVVLTVLLGPFAAAPALIPLWRHARRPVVLGLLAGGVAGSPAGTALLVLADPDVLRVMVALVVLLSTVALMRGAAMREPRRPLAASLTVGALSGALRSATSMGGPPVTLYLLSLRYNARAFVATSTAAYLLSSVYTVALYAVAGKVTGSVLGLGTAAVPAMAAGAVLGGWARARLSERRFRAAALTLLAGTSLTAIFPVLFPVLTRAL